jgi:transcription elongation factor Elf1
MLPMNEHIEPEEFISTEWTCPCCGSLEVSQSMDDVPLEDGTYQWYCLHCGWNGLESELVSKEVAL